MSPGVLPYNTFLTTTYLSVRRNAGEVDLCKELDGWRGVRVFASAVNLETVDAVFMDALSYR